jgi:two-component system chemotaxis sensor kinase CheA
MTNLQEEFADDFYAEAEELLANIRKLILAAEQAPLSAEQIQALFRAYHTLKGISGMMGFSFVEEVSHDLEAYLKNLQKEGRHLDKDNISWIIAGTSLIESNLSEKGVVSDDKISEWSDLKEKLNISKSAAGLISKATPDSTMAKKFKVIFESSRENFEQNITVNTVRDILNAHCQILEVRPFNDEFGRLFFEFIVASDLPCEEIQRTMPVNVLCQEYAGKHDEGGDRKPEEAHPMPQNNDTGTKPEVLLSREERNILKSGFVRVDISRLEDLMTLIGNLVISRSKFEEALLVLSKEVKESKLRSLIEINQLMERQLRNLREGVMRVRMVPIADAFDRMQYIVQEASRNYNRKIQLHVEGRETEIDKYVVERIIDSLLHLVRNAVSHGIEPPEERVRMGKPETGTITLKAFTSGDSVVLEIADDGRGIDRQKLIRKGIEAGILAPKNEVNDAEILDIMCRPGISSKDEADRFSGRGVGMDVVQRTIMELGGQLDFKSEPNRGTSFIIQLPLTIAILDALVLRVGNMRFALPQTMVSEVIQVYEEDITQIEGNLIMPYRNHVLSLIDLLDYFHLGEGRKGVRNVLVCGSGSRLAGLIVDRVEGIREIVVRSITDPLIQVPGISGATELGNGKLILIIDANALIKFVVQLRQKNARNVETLRNLLKNE